jgi:hypothetical protein
VLEREGLGSCELGDKASCGRTSALDLGHDVADVFKHFLSVVTGHGWPGALPIAANDQL